MFILNGKLTDYDSLLGDFICLECDIDEEPDMAEFNDWIDMLMENGNLTTY